MRRGGAGVCPAWMLHVVPSPASSGERERQVPNDPEVRGLDAPPSSTPAALSAPGAATWTTSLVGGTVVGDGVAPWDVRAGFGDFDFAGDFAGDFLG